MRILGNRETGILIAIRGYPQAMESYTHDSALCTQVLEVIHRRSVDRQSVHAPNELFVVGGLAVYSWGVGRRDDTWTTMTALRVRLRSWM